MRQAAAPARAVPWERLESTPVAALPGPVDEVADRVGDHFVSMLAGGGAAAKIEVRLRGLWAEHMDGRVEGDVLELVRGCPPPAGATDHAVQGLDGSLPTLGELGLAVPPPTEALGARCTTPAWTLAFGRAGAVVTESGRAFSHAAVVAREYGVPAVVACEGATSRLTDGMVVVVDGTRGRVERGAAAGR